MKQIPNDMAADLKRLLPLVIENAPKGKSTRLDNAVRLLGMIVRKLNRDEKK
jgi:hypothetical protein